MTAPADAGQTGGQQQATTGANAAAAAGDGGQQFTPIQSQADLDRILGERLSRERAKFADYTDLQKKAAEYDKTVEAQKTEAQKLTDRATAAEKAAADAALAQARAEVALAKGLTATQAKRLVGTTREELEADAAELLKDLGGAAGQQSTTSFDGGARGGSVKPSGAEQGLAEAKKRFGDQAGK